MDDAHVGYCDTNAVSFAFYLGYSSFKWLVGCHLALHSDGYDMVTDPEVVCRIFECAVSSLQLRFYACRHSSFSGHLLANLLR